MLRGGPGEVPAGHSIAEELQRWKLNSLAELFLKPWLAGITLIRPGCRRSGGRLLPDFSRSAALPAGGMAAIPQSIAAEIPTELIRLGVKVRAVQPGVTDP